MNTGIIGATRKMFGTIRLCPLPIIISDWQLIRWPSRGRANFCSAIGSWLGRKVTGTDAGTGLFDTTQGRKDASMFARPKLGFTNAITLAAAFLVFANLAIAQSESPTARSGPNTAPLVRPALGFSEPVRSESVAPDNATTPPASKPPNAITEEVAELRAKMKLMEQQNQALLNAMKSIEAQLANRAVQTVATLPAAAPSSTALATTIDQPPLKQDDVKKLVDDYLTVREQKTKEAAAVPQQYVVGSALGMTAFWNNGLWTESNDKSFRIHVGGRTQVDYVGYVGSQEVQFGKGGIGQLKDGVNFRRARLEVDGTLWEVIDFFAEYEFLGNTFNVDPATPANPNNIVNTPGPTDLWATLTHIPILGNFRVGSMKPPISLEHLTSSRWLDFMERSFAFDTYIGGTNNGFLPGMMLFNWSNDEKFTWAVGLFKNNQTVLGWNVGGGEWDATGRVTWLPIYEDNGRTLLHLGLGVSHRGLNDDIARLRARTLLRNGPFTLQTRLADIIVSGDAQTVVVPELALILGPFMVQAEYFGSWVTNTTFPPFTGKNFGTTYTQSAYVQTSYFLTGENRPWLLHGGSGAAPNRIVPNKNYYFVPGQDSHLFSSGAWQVAARFSWIDLDNQVAQAGTLYDVTLGLNWFLNPNMKFQWNFDYAFRNFAGNTSDGPIYGFGMRFAMDF
jgi:phosphate-selective porin OprO/OprP